MKEESRITLAIVCAAFGAVIGMGFGYAIEGFDALLLRPDVAFGIRLALTGSLAMFFLRKTLRETA